METAMKFAGFRFLIVNFMLFMTKILIHAFDAPRHQEIKNLIKDEFKT